MATWTFVKAVGAPAGTINIDLQGVGTVGVPDYSIDDTPGATLVTTNDAHGELLKGIRELTLQGVTGVFVPQPQPKRVVTVNGVLTEVGADGSSAEIPVVSGADVGDADDSTGYFFEKVDGEWSPVPVTAVYEKNATGDGVTVDTASMQADLTALGALPGRHRYLLRPDANYLVTSLTVPSNTEVDCRGATLTQTASYGAGGNGGIFYANGASGITIRNGHFVGGGIGANFAFALSGIAYISCTDIAIEGCTFTNFNTGGIYLTKCSRIRITGNVCHDLCAEGGQNAIHVGNVNTATANSSTIITGNIVYNCPSGGIVVTYAATGTFERVVISGNDVVCDWYAAIALEIGGASSDGSSVHKAVISGNVVEFTGDDTGGGGIFVSDNASPTRSSDASAFESLTITGNVVRSTLRGIRCDATRAVISGNEVSGTVYGIETSGNGVVVPGEIVVADNMVSMAANSAGGIVCSTKQTQIMGNRVTFATGSTSGGDGIYVGAVDRVSVCGNVVTYAPGSGIKAASATNFLIDGNHVINAGEGVTFSRGITVSAAAITGAGANAITNNLLVDNRSTAKAYAGISITSGASTCVVTGNTAYGHTHGQWFDAITTAKVCQNNVFNGIGGYGVVAITPSGSPFTHTALQRGTVTITGGTVSVIERKGRTTTLATGATSGDFHLERGDQLTVTYTVAPTMTFTQDL